MKNLVLVIVIICLSFLFNSCKEDNTNKAPVAPVITPESGEYSDVVTATISCSSPETDIYYTINGVEPDVQGQLYSDEIRIYENTTVKAVSFKKGTNIKSEIISNAYSFQYINPSATILAESDLTLNDNWDTFTIAEETDTWFELERSAENIEVQLVFSHTDGNIDVELIDVFGNVLDSSTSTTDGENLQYYYDEASTLYLKISLLSGVSSSYKIRWDDN